MTVASGVMTTDCLLAVLGVLTLLGSARTVRAACPVGCVCSQSLEDVACEHVDDFPLPMPATARNIQIAESSLREIPSHAFTALPHVVSITLHGVRVGAVRQFAFHHLAGRLDVTSLSVIDSTFDSIDSGAFSGVSGFKRILLHNCTVTNIEKGAFVDFSNINMFQVMSLHVAHIDSHAFANFRNVTSVGFSYWTAGHIRSHAFSDFRHIDKFDFSASKIESLGSRFIGIRYSASVSFYSLQVALLKKMAFADVSHVTAFRMYSSTIEVAEQEVFSHIHDVDSFHMLRMTIGALPAGFLPTRIRTLVFYSNKIDTLECGFLNETASMPREFRLANNKVTCDCRLLWLQTIASSAKTIVFDGFKCAAPEALKGGGLSSLFTLDTPVPCDDGITAVHDCLPTTTSTTTTTTTTTTTPPPTTTTPTTTTTTPTTTTTTTTTTTPVPTTTRATTTTTTPTTTTTTTTTTIPTTTTTTTKPTTTTKTISTTRTYIIPRSSTPLVVSLPLSTTTTLPRTAAADHGPIQAGVYSLIAGLVGTCLMVTYCVCEQR